MMNRLVCVIAVALVALTAWGRLPQAVSEPEARFDGQRVIRVMTRNQVDYVRISSIATDVWTHSPGPGAIDLRVTPEQEAAVRSLGLTVQVMIEDLQAAIDAERAEIARRRAADDLGWFENYKTLDEFNAKIDQLVAAYPGLVRAQTLGNSFQNRPIRAMFITGANKLGNPAASRRQVVLNGCQHAREWVSPMTVMFFADQLLERYGTDPAVRELVDRAEWVIVPIVNPDGYVYTWTTNRMWRKNRRSPVPPAVGVDLNRNWGYQWGGVGASTNPSNDTYRGPSAFSEPETQVMRDFFQGTTRARIHVDYHAYSQLILSPWGYTSALPPDAALFTQLNGVFEQATESVFGTPYRSGPVNTTIYPASGGANDWTYGARGILGWGLELRDTGQAGFLLPAAQILPTAQESFAGIRALVTEVIPAPCSADVNTDGIADFNDYLEFLNLYNTSDPVADLNGDGQADFNDYLEFLNLYNTGC